MVTNVMSRIVVTHAHLPHAWDGLWASAAVMVKSATRSASPMTVHVRGIGLRSLVNAQPRRVAPPIPSATGSVRPKPHVRPWGAMNAIQYQPRMPIQGRTRLTGMSPSHTSRKTMSRNPLMRSLFHRNAFGQIARLVDVASTHNGDVVRQELERNDRHQGGQELGCCGHDK